MTYAEMMEIGEVAFDEYLPKVSAKVRKVFLDALFTELEDGGALDIEDEVPSPDDVADPDDELY